MVDLGSKNSGFATSSPPDLDHGSAALTALDGEFDSLDVAAAPGVLDALRARRGPRSLDLAVAGLAMGALSVTVDAHTVPVVVTLVGELDLATATGLRLALENVLADSPASVVIDLAALGFIDASGLAVLATARQALRLRGGELVVRHPSPTLRKMLTITSLAAMVQEATDAALVQQPPESTVEDT